MLKYLTIQLPQRYNLTHFLPTFAPQKPKKEMQTTTHPRQTSTRHPNKMDDFHSWGVAALI